LVFVDGVSNLPFVLDRTTTPSSTRRAQTDYAPSLQQLLRRVDRTLHTLNHSEYVMVPGVS